MIQNFTALAAAAICAWVGWSMRRPGSTGLTRACGILAWAAASALFDDAFDGLFLGALTNGAGLDSNLEQVLKSL
jgi:hypothetical protein